MSKMYLRVGNSWTEIAVPGETDTYLINPTGVPVEVVETPRRQTQPAITEHSFVIGGSISQFHSDKSRYVYAKTLKDTEGEVTIVVNDSHMSHQDSIIAQEELDALSVQVMKLSDRVTENSLALVEHRVDYTKLLRAFIESVRTHEVMDAAIVKSLSKINKRLIASELLIFKHLKEYNALRAYVNGFETNSKFSKLLSEMNSDLASTMTSVEAINAKLNEVLPKLESGWSDYDGFVKQHIDPLKEEVKVLSTHFRTLSNALVKMSATLTPEEIEKQFAVLLPVAPADMHTLLTTIKNLLLELAVAKETNNSQSKELEAKLGTDDKVSLGMDATQLAELLNNDDDPTTGIPGHLPNKP